MRTEMRAAAYPDEDPQTRITPEENVDVFLYLASDDSRGVTSDSASRRRSSRGRGRASYNPGLEAR